MINKHIHLQSAFSLIELLIAIAIIMILTVIVVFGVQNAGLRARDDQRRADLDKMRSILEIYRKDHGAYPGIVVPPNELNCDSSVGALTSQPCASGETLTGFGTDWGYQETAGYPSEIATGLVPTYVSELPLDPLNNETYYYFYEPACNQDDTLCGRTVDCQSKGCCAYRVGAKMETTGTVYTVCSP